MNRLLALDLDGTLLNSQKEISPLTLSTLLEEQKRGALIVIASGRPPHGSAPFAELLRLKDFGGYVIAFNGGQILECKSGKMMFQCGLEPSALPHLQSLSHRSGCTLMTYLDGGVVTEDAQNPYVQYAASINRLTVRQVSNLPQTVNSLVPKCIIAGPPDELDLIPTDSRFVRSEPFFLEIMPEGIDKGSALSWLLRHIGLDASAVTAFGDSYNDATMLAMAGTSVAMANARPEIRQLTDFVTSDNDSDGIAQFLLAHPSRSLSL